MNYVIVPYRDREENYELFIRTMPDILTSVFNDNWKIIVVEQSAGKLFNRGVLLNIGFQISNDISASYIFHDIDTLPDHPESIERYGMNCSDKIIGIYNSIHDTLGGIIKISGEMFKRINGFPNDFWGWGCEDKELQYRAEFYNCKINKRFLSNEEGNKYFNIIYTPSKGSATSPDYDIKTNFYYNVYKTLSYAAKKKHIQSGSGLHNCKYDMITHKTISSNIEHYIVSI